MMSATLVRQPAQASYCMSSADEALRQVMPANIAAGFFTAQCGILADLYPTRQACSGGTCSDPFELRRESRHETGSRFAV